MARKSFAIAFDIQTYYFTYFSIVSFSKNGQKCQMANVIYIVLGFLVLEFILYFFVYDFLTLV